jgi:hypothetical protein
VSEAHGPPRGRPATPLRVSAGGRPSQGQLAALAAAVTALVEAERPVPADAVPAAYRSRWRRAALVEAIAVPDDVNHDRTAWAGGH